MSSINIADQYIAHAETIADKLYVKGNDIIRFFAKLCLLAWFIDHNLWKCVNWSAHLKFLTDTWNCGYFVMSVIVLIDVTGVLVACLMVLIQKNVPYACGFLLCIIIFQKLTQILASFWSLRILLKESSVIGSILMLLIEYRDKHHTHLLGEISFEEDRRRGLMQLAGRCLLVLMFIADLQSQRPSLPLILQDVMASTLMALVTLGYKTRLSALSLTFFLTVLNFYNNDWWNSTRDAHYVKYEFFQSITVVGGLLMVAILGPGRISVDEAKKHW